MVRIEDRDEHVGATLSADGTATMLALAERTHPVVAQILGRLDHDEFEDLFASLAPGTWAAYRAPWNRWQAFTTDRVLPLVPGAASVTAWIGWLGDDQGLALPTIRKHLAALGSLVDLAIAFGTLPETTLRPSEHPRVRRRLAGRARTAQHQPAKKEPLVTADIVAILATLAAGGRVHRLRRTRDASVVLLAFAGGFRRAELAALEVTDLTFRSDGFLEVWIRRAKGDQQGQGRPVGIAPGSTEATCPVRTLQRWLDAAGINDGPVFRPIIARAAGRREHVQPAALGAKTIAQIIKDAAARIGRDPATIAGHSTRRGHITTAVNAGATDGQIAATTGQTRTTIDGYTATRNVTTNSSRLLGL